MCVGTTHTLRISKFKREEKEEVAAKDRERDGSGFSLKETRCESVIFPEAFTIYL